MFDSLRKKLSSAIKGLVKKEQDELVEEQQAPPAGQAHAEEAKPEASEAPKEEQASSEAQPSAQEPEPAHEKTHGEHRQAEAPGQKHEGPGKGVHISASTRIKGVFMRSVALNDSDINSFLEGLRMALLEADVAYSTTDEFIDAMDKNLHAARFESRDIGRQLVESVRASMMEVLQKGKPGFELVQLIKERIAKGEAPVRVLFLGPNGTGKTTTIAKIAHRLKGQGITSVFSASDTFRAAAIEQTEFHANKVGAPVIKSSYGADPASIAFDAIAYAKAHGIGCVLIDTAGRQETNKNLIKEVEKMVRVAKPDVTIFVGESTSGNAISEQIKEFSKFIRIDGIILTKLDCDAKGGSALSIANVTGIPVLFFGTGEGYDALMPYDPKFIVDALVSTA